MNLDCNIQAVEAKPVTVSMTAIVGLMSVAAQNKQHVDTRSLTLFT